MIVDFSPELEIEIPHQASSVQKSKINKHQAEIKPALRKLCVFAALRENILTKMNGLEL
jgi:hypothetical protein